MNILSVDYDKLKSQGIKCLIFDYDNTLSISKRLPPDNYVEMLIFLSEKFDVRVYSNNVFQAKKRKDFFSKINIIYKLSFKPFIPVPPVNACVIGDKVLTDGLYAALYGLRFIRVSFP